MAGIEAETKHEAVLSFAVDSISKQGTPVNIFILAYSSILAPTPIDIAGGSTLQVARGGLVHNKFPGLFSDANNQIKIKQVRESSHLSDFGLSPRIRKKAGTRASNTGKLHLYLILFVSLFPKLAFMPATLVALCYSACVRS